MVGGATLRCVNFRCVVAWVLVVSSAGLAAEPKPQAPQNQDTEDPNALTFYEYDDGSGPQQVELLTDVPKKYRAKAKRITMNRTYGFTPAPNASRGPREQTPERRTSTRADPMPSAGESSGPKKAPAPPAPKTVVYCQYFYFQGQAKLKDSYCTSGAGSDATAQCEKTTFARFKEAIPCSCTDDKTYISTRCG